MCANTSRGSGQALVDFEQDEVITRAVGDLLQSLGICLRYSNSLHDVTGDVITAVVDGAEIANLALMEHRDVRRPRSHLYQCDAQLLLILGQDAQRAGEWLEHELAHVISGPLHRFSQVHGRRRADRDEIHLRLQSGTDHSDRIANSLILVYGIFLRNRVQQLSVLRNGLGPGNIVGAIDIGFRDLVAVHRDDSLADHRAYVLAGDSRVDRIDLRARHPLGIFDRFPDRSSGLLDIRDYSTTQSSSPRLSYAEDFEIGRALRVGRHRLADDRGGLRRTDVQSGDDVFRIH